MTVNEADPSTTDLVLTPDLKKVMLTMQHPLVHIVIQDSFEILRSSLLFIEAFPKGSLIVRLIKDALLTSAMNHRPGAGRIYQRLMHDEEYFLKILPLVSDINAHGYSTLAEAIYSHAQGSPFIDTRSKSGAVPLLNKRCW